MLVFLFMRIATICLTALLVTECHRKHDDNGLPNRGAIKVRPPAELLAVASTGKERNPGSGPSSDKPSQDTTWSRGLSVGVNGPIPLIVVDQFGYRAGAKKVAVIRSPQRGYDSSVKFEPGLHYALVDKASGTSVKKGLPTAWHDGAIDPSSGDRAWWFDFSEVTRPGTYTVVDEDGGTRSVEFEIDDGIYRRVLKYAVRMFYYQRAGFAKTVATAGSDWADTASHLGAGQDSQAHSWLAKSDTSKVKDLHGGWFDAGDYNKYTSWTARTIIVLLRGYEQNPDAFGDDFEIAESGNGVPDVLDEVKWALDWLKRMQNGDGSVLCVQGLALGSPPSAATGPSYYGPATTAASLMSAAAFAYAAKLYTLRREPELMAFGAELAASAKRAWSWANANPNVFYYNNDEPRQPGSKGLASGQQEMDDAGRLLAKFEAAVYLYELTQEAGLRTYLESTYTHVISSSGPTQWDADRQELLLYLTKLPNVTPGVQSAISDRFVYNVRNNPDQLAMVEGGKDPYRAPIKDYEWGSNMSKATQARIYQLLAQYGPDSALRAKADGVAEEYIHYIHGVNPLGLVYLTNMKRVGAEHSAKTLFHSWFADGSARWDETTDSTPGPAPGYLVRGPNPHFSVDSCCTAAILTPSYHCYHSDAFSLCGLNYAPPLGQPNQKSYLQFNSGWPAGSWSITEPSTSYQAQYVRVLAKYVK